jgi:methylated-DNA-protein-cysteine methyltransferase-like protein
MTRTKLAQETHERFYAVVVEIPPGRVATYGQVASLAGLDGYARHVGFALRALPEGSDIPWHRVVNARGEISARGEGGGEREQRGLLEAEGVVFERGRIPLARYRWEP